MLVYKTEVANNSVINAFRESTNITRGETASSGDKLIKRNAEFLNRIIKQKANISYPSRGESVISKCFVGERIIIRPPPTYIFFL